MFKVLFLCDKIEHYEKKLARMRFDCVDALNNLPNVHIDYWGVNWPGYTTELTFYTNYKNKSKKDKEYNLIIVYQPLNVYTDLKLLDIPVCLVYYDMSKGKRTDKINKILQEIVYTDALFVFCVVKKEMEFFKTLCIQKNIKTHKNQGPLFIHTPHHANKKLCNQYIKPFQEKTIDVSLVGNLSNKMYPLRYRAKLILKQLTKLGYTCQTFENTNYLPNDAYTYSAMKPYLKVIGNSKICISCSSRLKYKVCKYLEIPMCGTVLAADLPNEEQEDIKEYILYIDNKMSDTKIISKLREYIDNSDKCKKLIEKGYTYTNKYSVDNWAIKFIDLMKQYNIYIE
jgi:hypothetical protein